MRGKSVLIPALLGFACLLAATEAAQAQVRVYVGPRPYYGRAYYYPRYYYGPGPVVVVGAAAYPPVAYYPPPVVAAVPVPSAPIAAAPLAANNSATIRVLVPDPLARVVFDGALTNQTGTDRTFHTPPLSQGAPNTYRIRAIWVQAGREMVQESVVHVTPGRAYVVDFTKPASENLPPPG